MTIETSTDIVPLINVGTYWGPFEYERIWGNDIYNYKEDEGAIVCDDYDHAKFGEMLVEESNRIFEDEKPMSEYGVLSIKATKFWSPREYNFTDDRLYLDIEVTDDFLEKAVKIIMAPENKEKVSKYMEDNWKTRDGFISSMPAESYWELEQLFQDLGDGTIESYDYELGWGSVVALLWLVTENSSEDLTEGEGYLTELLEERVTGNHSLSEFCTILGRQEAISTYKEHTMNFGKFKAQLDRDIAKYCESGVPKDSCEKAERYKKRVLDLVNDYEERQDELIASFHPDYEQVTKYLDELREEWEETRDKKLEELWK